MIVSGRVLRGVIASGLGVLVLLASSFTMASATAPSPGNSLARSLLNDAVLPPGAVLVHPGRTVVCQCAGVPADATYLITMHRYYVVAGTPAAAEKFLATHIPKGGVGGGEGTSYSNNGPEVLSTSTAFPANGPHVYLRQLGYSMTAKSSTSSWLRVDSQVVWVPSRTSAQKVTGAVSATVTAYKSVGLFGSSGGTKIHGVGDVANECWRDAGSWTGESELEFFEVLTSASTENLQTSTVRDGVLVPFASIAYMISATPGGGTNLKDAERRLTGSTTI